MAMDLLALFDLDTLKDWCKVGSSTEHDDLLARIGNGASAYAERRIGQQFKSRTYTIVRSGDNRPHLLRLPRPIVSVSSLSLDDVAIAASAYAVNAESGVITLKDRVFSAGVGNVAVTLVAGYADAELPFDVVAAALDLAKSHYDEWNVGGITLASVSIGPASAIMRPGLNPRVEKFLDAHRDVRG